MARRNIHQSKRLKKHKQAPAVRPVAQPAATAQPAAAAAIPIKSASAKASAVLEAASVRFAELPYELRRIALFSALVVVALIVLWFFLK